MEDPNADTEWNDILRQKGILPPKEEKEITEDEVVNIVEDTIKEKLSAVDGKTIEDLTLDELDLIEDDEDERVLLEYRRKRIAEMKAQAIKNRFGDVREISADTYVEHVNKAGEDVWVVLHLYKHGIPLCTLINNFFYRLAAKFPATKFLKSVSSTCIPNYPERNLPTIFVYYEGQMKKQLIGPEEVGGQNLKIEELEWMLADVGAVKTDLECDPRKKVKDILMSALVNTGGDDW